MNDETRTVAWAVLVFATAFLLVYVLFFGMHGKELSNVKLQDGTTYVVTSSGDTKTTTTLPATTQWVQQEKAAYQEMDPKTYQAYYGSLPPAAATRWSWPEIVDGKTFYSVNDLFAGGSQEGGAAPVSTTTYDPRTPTSAWSLQPGQVMLSNTFVWESKKWPFKPLDFLGLVDNAQYILKDVNNTHYIYLGTFSEDIRPTVQRLGGNVVEIKDQTAIRNGNLFWENVQLISIPQMPTKQLLLVRFWGGRDVWFLQVDSDYFEGNKAYMQQQFDFAYADRQ